MVAAIRALADLRDSLAKPMSSFDPHFGAIDVGSNAARLKIARVAAGGLHVVHSERMAIATGAAVFRDGLVGADAGRLLAETLGRFAHTCRFYRAGVRAVATSALRGAADRDTVVARVYASSGLTLDVISGLDEARLACLGVRGGAGVDERALCIDVGGGSTEVVLAHGERPERLWSGELGALRLGQSYGDDLTALRAAASHAVAALAGDARSDVKVEVDVPVAIGCSGSVRALIDFATERARDWATVHELGGAAEELARMRPKRRLRFFSPARAQVIVPAAAILEAVLRHFGVYSVRATRRGLRDGILLELARASALPAAQLRA
jgi:exopolyphosphatase/guanosine-5'-triphosphate,3'-diphosphate pyrophosphatase